MTDAADETNHVTEIGRMAVSCGHIEMNVSLIAAILIDPVGDVGTAVVAGEQFSRTVNVIRRVAPRRLADDPEHAGSIVACVNRASRVMDTRNRVLHSVWNISRDSAIVLIKNQDPQEWGLQEIVDQADDAYDAAVDTGDCWMNLAVMYGHMDDLIAATNAMIAADEAAERDGLQDAQDT